MSELAPPLPLLPENPSLFTRARVALKCLEVLQKDPANPEYADLFNTCMDRNLYSAFAEDWSRNAEGRRLLAERPSLEAKDLDLSALERLPDGTLGREFVRYFQTNGIKPFVSAGASDTDFRYVVKRLRETHDLYHVVTGYGTDPVGELELQAFQVGNLHFRSSLFIVVVSLANVSSMMKIPFSQYARRLWAAFRRGARSRYLASFRFEEHWETPVAQLRAALCAPAVELN